MLDRTTTAAAWAGVACLSVAMLFTLADICLRAISRVANSFLSDPIGLAVPGVVDIVQLSVMGTAFLGIPYAFLSDGHVSVDLVARAVSKRIAAVMRGVAALLAAGFLAAVVWFGWQQMINQVGYGDRSSTLGIPILWFWLPLLTGGVLSVGATILVAVRFLAIGATATDPAPVDQDL